MIGAVLLSLLLLLPPTAAALADAGGARAGCQVCGMYIDQYQQTTGALKDQAGKTTQTCGVACLLRLVQDAGGPDAFAAILVRDFKTGKETQAREAVYVLSSDLTPDMMPSIIAFATREAATSFQQEHHGELITFDQALAVISPMAMTMPTRLQSAVLPAQGSFGLGVGGMHMEMDTAKIGSESEDPYDLVVRQGGMGPKVMTADGTMIMASYGITDALALGVNASYLDKKMESYTMGGKGTAETINRGLSDIDVSLRYNLWKNTGYSQFVSLLGGVSLPTGEFDTALISMPGVQMGTGDYTLLGGLLYTYRLGDFWLHASGNYRYKLENRDDYKFGDDRGLGLAVHYTPNYNLMVGLEADAVSTDKNEYNNVDVAKSGGFRGNLAGVASWRFLTALGGNFSLKLAVGLPLYEDLNHETAMGMEKTQLGGGWFGNLSLSFQRRLAVNP